MNKVILVFVSLFLVAGCKSTKNAESDLMKNGYAIVTVLDNRKVDACGFLLVDNNNKRYEPTTLPDSVKVNGLKIGVRFTFVKGAISSCMSGPIVKINDIVYLKK